MVTALSENFLAEFLQRRSGGAVVLDLVAQVADLAAGAALGDLLLDLRRYVFIGLLYARIDLADQQQHGAELPLHRLAHFAWLEREGSVGNGRVDDFAAGHGADIGVGGLQPAFLGDVVETRALGDLLARRGGVFRLLEHHLTQLACLRLAVIGLVLVEIGFCVGVGNIARFGDLRRGERQHGDLAVFRRAEQHFAVVVIAFDLLRSRLRHVTRLRRAQRHIFDAAGLGLILADRRQHRLGHLQLAADALGDLPAQQHAALLGDVGLLGKVGLADHRLEALAVEFPLRPAEVRIAGDQLGDVGVGKAEPPVAHALVQRGLGDQLPGQLPVDAERMRLVRRDRAAELAAELLQAVVVELAELVDGDFGAADLGDRIEPEATKNIADAPDGEADDQDTHDGGHDGFAEPGGGGFMHSAEHARASSLGFRVSACGEGYCGPWRATQGRS